MMFDSTIGTKTTQRRPEDGPKELHVLSWISTWILAHVLLHFGLLLGSFCDLKIGLKSTLIFYENLLAAT